MALMDDSKSSIANGGIAVLDNFDIFILCVHLFSKVMYVPD